MMYQCLPPILIIFLFFTLLLPPLAGKIATIIYLRIFIILIIKFWSFFDKVGKIGIEIQVL